MIKIIISIKHDEILPNARDHPQASNQKHACLQTLTESIKGKRKLIQNKAKEKKASKKGSELQNAYLSQCMYQANLKNLAFSKPYDPDLKETAHTQTLG